ncbi:anti-phage ZorAB system protein ZorA [Sulfurimonas sp.]|uniref:anti-phage ZorAB system protein ZorA n=1 Tax=Sulfurimonas sp. TaxID=2022749 RepID=UPI002608B749|nr:anti-phage ZorAB system protein ZorA [Sulfurimonas sp.]MDD3854887.1 anti-phage ZorAB system protein ZorA [Sulfurimonas sp.]
MDISSEYTELLEEINNSNPKLLKLWKEFDESLIKKSDGNAFVIRNSIDAEYFFNKKTMISHLGSKLFASIPGMLLGIGLLGTFTGLYFALIQLDVSDVAKLQDSIKILINMAGVKFAASIWGLGLSVLFTFVDKQLEACLENKLDKIQIMIDQIFIRETAEQNLDSILSQNTQQTKALNGLATSLTEKIAAEFNTTLIPKIELLNNQFNNMPQQISQAINDTFQKPLTELSDTVKNLTTNQAEKSNEVLENIMKEFLKELKSAAGDEGEKLKAASTQSQDILLSTSEKLQSTFNSMQTMFQEQQSISTARDNKIIEDLNQIKQDQQEMIQNLSSSVKDNISTMNSEVSDNISKLVQAIQTTNTKQQEASQQRETDITSSVNGMLSNIEKSMSKQIEDDNNRNKVVISMLHELNTQNKELIAEISSTVSGQMNSLNSNSQQLFEKLISQFDNHIDKVKSSVDSILGNLKTEVQNIDVIMSSASKQLIGLPSHLEKVSQSTDKLLKFSDDLTQSINKLLQFNSDFVNTQENLDKYSQNILSASTELKNADSNLKETLNNSKVLLSDMTTQFEELANKNSDTIDTFGTKVDKFMNDYHKHVEKAIQDNIVHQLDNALSGYAHTMAEAISSLSDAIDELREKEIR